MREEQDSQAFLDEVARHEADDGDDPFGVQLGLFTPEVAEVEAGFAALGRLELDRADALFAGIVEREPDNEDGQVGLAAVSHWRRTCDQLASLPALERAMATWCAVRDCPAPLITRTLRRRLLEEVLGLLELQASPVRCPDLCVADVLLALHRPGEARRWLEWATRSAPGSARLFTLYGDALYDVSVSQAKACYSRGLLVDPTLPEWRTVAWPELAGRVADAGGATAALELWAAGQLPMPPPDAAVQPHPSLAEVWRAMAHAEAERRRGRHDEAIDHRRLLLELAPEIFHQYMARLEGG
jgi:tetratricopeptide (TPR) repeat protein